MVDYPDLSSLSANGGISELLALPNASYPFYWGLMLIGFWLIFSLTLYYKEKGAGEGILGKGNLLSSMAVSAFANILLGTIMTLNNLLTLTVFLPLLVGGLVLIAIWIFSN
jgi:hypothetical protein